MSVKAMERLTVIAPLCDADAIMTRLMRLRTVSLQQNPANENAVSEIEKLPSFSPHTDVSTMRAKVACIEAILPVLSKHSKRRRGLLSRQVPISPDAYRTDGRYDTACKVVDEATKMMEKQAELRAAREAALARMHAYAPYLNLSFPADFAGTESTRYTVGSLPGGIKTERAEAALEGLAALLTPLSADGTGQYLSLITHKADHEAAMHVLSGLGFLPAPLPREHLSVRDLYGRVQKELRHIDEQLERLENALTVLAEKLGEVEILYDIERTALLNEENKQQLRMTEQCVVLCGWCPVSEKERVTAALADFTAAYEFSPPQEGDDVPVLLKNHGFAKSFEWVLGMYAYPRYGTFDPTLVMSIFYFLIFGLMFADAGYGFVMSLLCFVAVHWLKPRESMKRFLLMFGYCGISCMLFGVLFGSYFGNFPLAFLQNVLGRPETELPNLALLPTTAANVAVLFDPIDNPMAFLLISLGVGALHLLAGMAVKAFILCRQGKVLDALFDVVSYWILFAGLGALAFSLRWAILLLSIGVLAIVLTQGRRKKGIAGKIVGGLLGLYDLVSYASDLLSYSRVLALGLAAGVIAQVVNILATLKGGTFLGFILMIVVFVIGHLLNLVINVLGTFVHTSRLQYIEFFNKFYEEGGTPFRPMAPSDRYTVDVSQKADTSPTQGTTQSPTD
ncbi:MAG: hypothetical protein IJY50_01995 [Clostridia bacterium]|nr:hypothetical protein [Clostridia bacterium]